MVYVTCGSEDEARELSVGMIENKLAACANIADVTSVYEWKGKIKKSGEKLLIVKTLESIFPELEKFIKKNHSYECPEIIAMEVKTGSNEYIHWVNSIARRDKS